MDVKPLLTCGLLHSHIPKYLQSNILKLYISPPIAVDRQTPLAVMPPSWPTHRIGGIAAVNLLGCRKGTQPFGTSMGNSPNRRFTNVAAIRISLSQRIIGFYVEHPPVPHVKPAYAIH